MHKHLSIMSTNKHYDYPFFAYNKNNNPYVSSRNKEVIKNIIHTNKNVSDRCRKLFVRGFHIKRCYIPHYNGIGGYTYMPRLNEIRIIIGRPLNHEPREVYAIIIKPNQQKDLNCGFKL
jgi:hypothetical protein